MGDWLHGAWALYSVLAWTGKSKRLDLQASLYTWACDPESEWEAGVGVLILVFSMCLLFPEPRDSEWWAGVPGAVGRLEEEHISPAPPGIPWRQGEPPLVHSGFVIASRLSSGLGSGHSVTCPLPVSLKLFISWLIWKILHGYITWSPSAGQFLTCSPRLPVSPAFLQVTLQS